MIVCFCLASAGLLGFVGLILIPPREKKSREQSAFQAPSGHHHQQ